MMSVSYRFDQHNGWSIADKYGAPTFACMSECVNSPSGALVTDSLSLVHY